MYFFIAATIPASRVPGRVTASHNKRTYPSRSRYVGRTGSRPAASATICRKIHGLRMAPRPTMTPAAPVRRCRARAVRAETTLPLATTGQSRLSTARRMAALSTGVR